ncbi:phage tail tape measure protein [Sphingomonas phyllosphaerae]|uniref:phage tail tape measure protein n=1 Tax=Sphingomonas phyllosphaerae TaxID=257003 RepID=UPI000403794F|nr:phage tail tape measure protein [Sphingomonas phyllosphaerae]
MDRNLRIRMLLEAGDRFSKPLRDLASGGRNADAALKGARDRLKEIERTKGNVDAFRQLKTDSVATGRALEGAKTKVGELSRAMAQAETPTRAMTRDLERARREVASLTRQHEGEERQLHELRTALREAGVATNDLARHDRELRAAATGANRELEEQLRRTDQLADRQRRMGAARERFNRMQDMAGNIAGAGAGAIAGGVAVGAGVWEGVKAAQSFESVMTDIAQKADLSRVQAARMGKELLGAARAANQLPEDLQAGVDVLAGFGLDPRQAVAMMKPIGRAATAYKAEIADLSSAAFAAHDNLKVPIADTGRMIDAMAQAGKSGAFEIKDMAQYFPTLTAAYQGLGQTGVNAGADLAAAAQITRKGAGDSATAATNLANILQKISSPATNKAFSKLGVDLPAALQRAYKEGKTPIEALAELTNRALKGDLSKLGYLFEDAQVQQGLRPLIQNIGEYRKIRAEAIAAAQANRTTDTDFAERLKDSDQQTKALAINAKVLAVNMGTLLLPAVNGVTEKLAALTGLVASAAERHPLLAKGAALAAAGLAVLMVTFGVLAIGAAAILGPIALANAGLVAMGITGGAASIGLFPIIATIAGVVAVATLLAGAAYLIYQHWGAISGFFTRLWVGVKGAFASAGAFIMDWGPRVGRFLMDGLLTMLSPDRLVARIVQLGRAAIGAFKGVLGIHSPSRVFAGLGGFMMAGLDRGLDDGARRPIANVRRVAGALAGTFAAGAAVAAPGLDMEARGAGARQALSRGAGALAQFRAIERGRDASRSAPAPAGPAEYHFHITQAPGQSAEDLARAIRAELQRMERQNAAARRSTFRDDPDGADV